MGKGESWADEEWLNTGKRCIHVIFEKDDAVEAAGKELRFYSSRAS